MTAISDLCYERKDYSGQYAKVGCLFYFRGDSPSIKIRIDTEFPDVKVIGLYLKDSPAVKEKFDEAPYVEADLFVRFCGNYVKVGHIHSSQNELGETLYWIQFGLRIKQLQKFAGMFETGPIWIEGKCE